MKTEMDIMRLDERRRLCWLKANRVTLMVVGLCWLGLIGWELAQGRTPLVLIFLVPVFALLRFGVYKLYARRG
jgi:hypothetical protein